MRTWIDHAGWKVFSIGAAVLLWYSFAGEVEMASTVPISVEYRNIPPDMEITTDSPERLFVKLRGPASQLRAAELQGMALTVDLSTVHSAGDQSVTIDEEQMGLPRGVKLVRATPSQVRVHLEKRVEKTVPVELRYAGPPPEGYRIISRSVHPPSVRVAGPESRVARLEAALTDPIDLSSTVGSSEFRVPVYLEDPQVRLEGGSPLITAHVVLEKIPGK